MSSDKRTDAMDENESTIDAKPETGWSMDPLPKREATSKSSRSEGIFEFPDIDGFLIEGELGKGAHGQVFKAIDMSLLEPVAIKVLNPIASKESHLRERFEREIKAYHSLKDGHVIQLRTHGRITQGVYKDCPYVIMEFMDGGTFGDWMIRFPAKSKESLQASVKVLVDVCKGLTYLHKQNIVHRDLKPDNILLAELDANAEGQVQPGQIRLSDFGLIANLSDERDLSRTGMGAGTPAYMSPEQFVDSKNITPASDQYAIGVMLYQLLCNRRPWQTSTEEQEPCGVIEAKALSKTPCPPPSSTSSMKIDKQLKEVCLRCLEINPQDRYPNTGSLARNLENWLRGEPIEDERNRLRLWCRRHILHPIKRQPGRSLAGFLSACVFLAMICGALYLLAVKYRELAQGSAEMRAQAFKEPQKAWKELESQTLKFEKEKKKLRDSLDKKDREIHQLREDTNTTFRKRFSNLEIADRLHSNGQNRLALEYLARCTRETRGVGYRVLLEKIIGSQIPQQSAENSNPALINLEDLDRELEKKSDIFNYVDMKAYGMKRIDVIACSDDATRLYTVGSSGLAVGLDLNTGRVVEAELNKFNLGDACVFNVSENSAFLIGENDTVVELPFNEKSREIDLAEVLARPLNGIGGVFWALSNSSGKEARILKSKDFQSVSIADTRTGANEFQVLCVRPTPDGNDKDDELIRKSRRMQSHFERLASDESIGGDSSLFKRFDVAGESDGLFHFDFTFAYGPEFSRDGNVLMVRVSQDTGWIGLIDALDGKNISWIEIESDCDVAFADEMGDSLVAISASRPNAIDFYCAHSGRRYLSHEFVNRPCSLSFSMSGHIVVGHDDGQVSLVGNRHTEYAEVLLPHHEDVASVSLSPAGKLLATIDATGRLRIWDIESESIKWDYFYEGRTFASVSFEGDGSVLASFSEHELIDSEIFFEVLDFYDAVRIDIASGETEELDDSPIQDELRKSSLSAASQDGRLRAHAVGKAILLVGQPR